MKKYSSRIALMLAWLAFLNLQIAFGQTPSSGSPIPTLRITYPYPKDSPVGTTAETMIAALRERLSGHLDIIFIPPEGSATGMLASGKADLAITPTMELNEVTKGSFAVFDLPFLFESAREVVAVQQSSAGVSALASLQPLNMVGFGYWNNGVSALVTWKPIVSATDLRGQKIRVESQSLASTAWSQLGASTVQMALTDVSPAITTGAVDGFEATLPAASGILSTTPHAAYFATQVRPLVATVVMSDAAWRELSFRAQSILTEEIESGTARANRLSANQDDEAREVLARFSKVKNVVLSINSLTVTQSAWSKTLGIEGTNLLEVVLPIIEGIRKAPSPTPERRGAIDEPTRVASADPHVIALGDVFFATDRAWENDVKPVFRVGSKRGPLSFGLANFSIAPSRRLGQIDDKLAPLKSIDTISESDFSVRIGAMLSRTGKNQIVIFVHGFNNTFESASRALALLSADINFGGVPILYSWPSDGLALRYASDEEEVRVSRDNFLAFVVALSNLPSKPKIHVAAHSMGNRLVAEAIDRFDAQRSSSATRLFDHVVMAAPDLYVRLFEQMAAAVKRRTRKVTLYASESDAALICSRKLHANRRLGEAGTNIFLKDGIDTIDASPVDPRGWSLTPCWKGHSYMMRSVRVQADIQSVIQSDLPPSQRYGLKPKQIGQLSYWEFRPSD